jgi:hypothetical protein
MHVWMVQRVESVLTCGWYLESWQFTHVWRIVELKFCIIWCLSRIPPVSVQTVICEQRYKTNIIIFINPITTYQNMWLESYVDLDIH